MKPRLLLILAVLGLTTAALACWDQADRSSGEQAPTTAAMERPIWEEDYILYSHEGAAELSDASMSLFFTKGATLWLEGRHDDASRSSGMFGMFFSVGCNDHVANVTFSAQGELISDGIAGTQKYCAQTDEQERWVAQFMDSAPRLSMSEDTLILAGDDATLTFRRKDYARSLSGQPWTIGRLIVGAGYSWHSIHPPPTVAFFQSGSLSLFDGCNTSSGQHAVRGDQIVLSSLQPITDAVCTDDKVLELSEQVRAVFADGTVQHTITADRLRIERGSGGLTALAR